MMADVIPFRRAASMSGIGHCSAYRIRDELNTERAAQGKPPIAANQWRTAAGKRAAKAAEWLDGAADILRFRALVIELGDHAARRANRNDERGEEKECVWNRRDRWSLSIEKVKRHTMKRKSERK